MSKPDYSERVDKALDSLANQDFLNPGGSDETELLIAALLDQAGYSVAQQHSAALLLDLEILPVKQRETFGERE